MSLTQRRYPPPVGRRVPRRRVLAACGAVLGALALLAPGANAAPVPAGPYVSGVTFPFNGVWLDDASPAGGHYWDASGAGLCRIDQDPVTLAFSENVGTCDVQAKKPTQAVVDPATVSTTTPYFVYAADMSSKSGGPVRLTFDPTADGGNGAIVAGSGTLLGGANVVGFFADSAGNFKNSSVALGPCDHSTSSTITASNCKALYLGFERSKMIERINFVDQPVGQQSLETISKVTDPRKGVRFGIGMFHNAGGSDDLYIDELGGNGVSMISDVGHCSPSLGSSTPTVVNPPTNQAGGCAATVVGGITTNFPQGIVIQNDASGNGHYIYYSDSPRTGQATILRYDPNAGVQDVISSSVTPYDSLLNPGETVSTYTFVLGLALNPHTGDLIIGDDPTFAVLVNPPLNKGHLFKIDAVAGVLPAECLGTTAAQCTQPPAPSTVTPKLYAYGLTAPKGGTTFVPSDNGGHLWAADHSQGLCRLDVVQQAPGLHAFNTAACDDGTLLGSGGQTVYDDTIVPGSTNLHYLYVAQNDHLSPGVIRFTYDPSADNGDGMIVGNGVVMAPNAGLSGDKANGLAIGPCVRNADGSQKFPTCKHALYMGGLLDGFIRRINNPEDAPSAQSVDVVAMTTEQRAGQGGKGINGSMGMLGDDLYLPENQGFTVVKNISGCPRLVQGTLQACGTTPLNIGQFGFIFGSAVGVDPDPSHSSAGLVYAAISPGAANATVYQYDVATNTSRVYATRGQLPAANTAEATVYCSTTCTRPVDPANPPGGFGAFRFAQGAMVDANGTLYLTEDAFAGARGGRGHAWWAPFTAYPPGATPVPLPQSAPDPPANQVCKVTVNVPGLSGGQTYWVQFTAHAAGQLSATWTTPIAQSAQLLMYPNNPFNGLADPVNTGSKGGFIARQVTSNTRSFSISTAPNSQPLGTYTVQFFNAGSTFGSSTGTISYVNDGATACPTTAASNIVR
ncbi:MAG: hypothetical protein QOG70_3718 [Solirubrobacteraceae bacterium]|nr:hypothetical protein [Solirubrobacteraceae bacterium]